MLFSTGFSKRDLCIEGNCSHDKNMFGEQRFMCKSRRLVNSVLECSVGTVQQSLFLSSVGHLG